MTDLCTISNEVDWLRAVYRSEPYLTRDQRADLRDWRQACRSAGDMGDILAWPGWDEILGPDPGYGPAYDLRAVPEPLVASSYISPVLRRAVYDRDGWACLYCGADDDLSCDHIHPRSRGGPTILENLQTLCRPCNSSKGARTPEEIGRG